MNVASRMESTGLKGKIQISQETAALLTTAGKESMITPRHDKVFAKGELAQQEMMVIFPYRRSKAKESYKLIG